MADNMFSNTPAYNAPSQQNIQPEADVTAQVPTEPQTPPSPNDMFADQLASIRAEDGRQKYADVSTALQSIPHAQTKIQELNDELETLRAEVEKRKGAEDIMSYIQSGQPVVSPPASSAAPVEEITDVSSLVAAEMARIQAVNTQRSNVEAVKQELVTKYGDTAANVFASKAQELGVTVEYLTAQAAQYPEFVKAQFKSAPATAPAAKPTLGTLNTNYQQDAPVEKRSVMRGSTSRDVLSQWRAHKV